MTTSDKTMVALFSVELAATIVGNTFLLVLLFKSKLMLRSASQNFILNCSFADLLSCLINIPFAMDYLVLKTGNLTGAVAPVIINFMITFLMMLTLHSTFILMADRLFIIKYPVKYKNMMTVKRGRMAIVTMWCSTFLFTLILKVTRLIRNPSFTSESPMEFMMRQFKTNGGKFFVFFMMVLVYATLAVLTGMLDRSLRKLLKTNQDGRQIASLNENVRRTRIKTSSRTVLLVMMIYMVCYFPTLLNAFLRILNDPLINTLSETTRAFVTLFSAQMSSVINPIVFVLRSTVLRRSAMKIFKKRSNRVAGIELSNLPSVNGVRMNVQIVNDP